MPGPERKKRFVRQVRYRLLFRGHIVLEQTILADCCIHVIHLTSQSRQINAYFDAVLVMADDPAVRGNRLKLVADVASTVRLVGDFEQLPG